MAAGAGGGGIAAIGAGELVGAASVAYAAGEALGAGVVIGVGFAIMAAGVWAGYAILSSGSQDQTPEQSKKSR